MPDGVKDLGPHTREWTTSSMPNTAVAIYDKIMIGYRLTGYAFSHAGRSEGPRVSPKRVDDIEIFPCARYDGSEEKD
jgi:hypothetical protein